MGVNGTAHRLCGQRERCTKFPKLLSHDEPICVIATLSRIHSLSAVVQTLARRATHIQGLLPQLRDSLGGLLSAPNAAVHAGLLALLAAALPAEPDDVAGAHF